MLSAVLQSARAVAVSIEIVRVFVRLRKLLASHDALARKLTELESRMGDHDEKFAMVFDAIRQLIDEDRRTRRKPAIGYHTEVGSSRRKRRG
jgi:nitrate reductase assembly molybdenum cofactor insertion protein NarJ